MLGVASIMNTLSAGGATNVSCGATTPTGTGPAGVAVEPGPGEPGPRAGCGRSGGVGILIPRAPVRCAFIPTAGRAPILADFSLGLPHAAELVERCAFDRNRRSAS